MLPEALYMLRLDTRGLHTRIGARLHDDILFHDHVGRATDKQQMFNIVAADEYELASAVDRRCVHHRKAGLPGAPIGDESTATETANDAEHNENSAKNDRKY